MRLNTMSSNGALGSEEFYNYVTKFSMFYLYIGLGVLFAAFIQVKLGIVKSWLLIKLQIEGIFV